MNPTGRRIIALGIGRIGTRLARLDMNLGFQSHSRERAGIQEMG
jgi:hypothetical protein